MNNGTAPAAPRGGWIGRMMAAQGLFGRALRGSVVIAGAYGVAQALRLASNLVLARLLFPEAFGLMALVTMIMVGLQMLSDVGISPAISQHARGDDPAFLDTAFSINVLRGLLLWLMACAVAYPVAVFYEAPQLAQLVPVAGLGLLVAGFNTTRIDTAMRHLALVRVTLLDLAANFVGVAAMVVLALVTRSVWALVIGGILANVAKLVFMRLWLPGHRDRLRWERDAARDLIGFGKWIFLSTLCAFVLLQGDKMIFGAYLSLADLGIYNIGYFLASFPILLAGAVTGRIMIPLYRERPEAGEAAATHDRRIRRLRYLLSAGIVGLLGLLAFFGVPLIDLMYGERYARAGAVVVLVACVQMVPAMGSTYEYAALAAGDSRRHFFLQATRAAVQAVALLVGINAGGLYGALAGQAIALLLLHAGLVLLARKHKAWDPVHDLVFLVLSVALAALAIGWNRQALGF